MNKIVYIAISGDDKIKFFNLDEEKVLDFISNYNYALQLRYMKRLENSYEIFDDSIKDYSFEIDLYLLHLFQTDLVSFLSMRERFLKK